MAYTEFGNIYTWGDNSHGQLGIGNMEMVHNVQNITDKIGLKNQETVV